jgi:threonine aldolase
LALSFHDKHLDEEQLKEKNILVSAFGPGMVRFVFHRDISSDQVHHLAAILPEIRL